MCDMTPSRNVQNTIKDKARLPIIKYTGKFKELIKKVDITGANAIYQYGLGLTPKEYEKIASKTRET